MYLLNTLGSLKSAFEIIILWLMIYELLLFFAGTKAMQALRGIIMLCVAFFLAQRLNLEVLSWLMTKLFAISVIAVLIIFHPEIRQALARLGQGYLFSSALKEEERENVLKEIIKAAENLVQGKCGALMAIEKNDSLKAYTESGEVVDARVLADLIQAIFTPVNPLHDGGLIIQNARILAAGCIFPLSANQDLSRVFGMRHRAALGLSEETDAIIVVVSEERGDISLVYRGRLYRDLGRQDLLLKIKEFLKVKKEDA